MCLCAYVVYVEASLVFKSVVLLVCLCVCVCVCVCLCVCMCVCVHAVESLKVSNHNYLTS